jgi:hypothetical protein
MIYNNPSSNDPANWKTDAPTYSSISYTGLYNGVYLIFRDPKGKIERQQREIDELRQTVSALRQKARSRSYRRR